MRRGNNTLEQTIASDDSSFKMLVEHARDIIGQVDVSSRCLFVNPAIQTVTGLNPAFIIGKTFAELGLEEHISSVMFGHLSQVIRKGTPGTFQISLGVPPKVVWYEASLVPQFSSDGKVDRVSIIARDITDLKECEQSLRHQEGQLRLMVDSMEKHAMFLLDERGRFENWNKGAERLTGFVEKDILLKDFSWLFTPEDKRFDRALQELNFARENGRSVAETVLQRKDGSHFFAETIISSFWNGSGKLTGFAVIISDITEQKRFQEQTNYQRALLEALTETSPDGILVSTEKRILYYNRRFVEIWGFPQDVMESHSDEIALEWAANSVKNVEEFRSRVADAYKSPEKKVVGQIMLKDMRILEHYSLPVHGSDGRYYGRVWFFRDVTFNVKATEALKESEERFRVVAEAAPIAIFRTDPEGNVTYHNPAWERITGLGPEVSSMTGWTRVIHPEDMDETLRTLEQALSTGEIWKHEFRIQTNSGQMKWIRAMASSVRNNDGKVIARVGTFENITERKQAEKILEEARQKLQSHAHELEECVDARTSELRSTVQSIEGCLYTVAHDFKAPLRAIEGFTTTILDEYAGGFDKRGQELAVQVVRSVKRMDNMISDFLDYGKLTYMEMPVSPVSLDRCVDLAVARFQAKIQDRRAEVHIQRPLGMVMAYEPVLLKIFLQLISNALKFVAPAVEPRIRIDSTRLEDCMRICVQDNGIGIDFAYHDRVFRIFERLHGHEVPGTGIGLAIVQKGIERMNGRVKIDPDYQLGTRVCLELPRAD